MITMRVQEWLHKLEVGGGAKVLQYIMLAVVLVALLFVYDIRAYRGFTAPEAMDAAQVARNLESGRGFSTDFIRPFSLYLVQQHNLAANPELALSTNTTDLAKINGPHPDLANPPLYPAVLAGLMKIKSPDWHAETRKPFWSNNGRFMRYQAEFNIAIFNQILLLVVVTLTFFLTQKLFDRQAAWLAALLLLGSDLLWKFSVSGLSTMLLLVIFLGLILCLVKIEELGRSEIPKNGKLITLSVAAGLLVGLGMLTRYSFGTLIVPTAIFLVMYGGLRRKLLPVVAIISAGVIVTPWITRNLMVSGTLFGTAGYAFVGDTFFPGSQLMQSMNPNLKLIYYIRPYLNNFVSNFNSILQDGLFQLGGGCLAILFFGGLMFGLRSLAARRLRYFILISLGVLMITQAFGKTALSALSPSLNSENLLVLLAPLVVIFGTVFFLTLLDQMKLPALFVRYGVIALLFVFAWQPLAANVLAKASPVAYPPYYPPEIQQVSDWMKPDELLMSDVPWAVAWYGQRKCVWLTRDAQSDFYTLYDYYSKPVRGIFFSTVTMDEKFFSEMARADLNGWEHLVLTAGMLNQFPPGFPLKTQKILGTGLMITDRPRWDTQ